MSDRQVFILVLLRKFILQFEEKVVLKILAYDGEYKLVDKTEETIYTIKPQPNVDISVYVIK